MARRCRLRCARCPCERICGADIDDVFAYKSTKSVEIRDHRLGCFYHLALLGAIGYIGLYTLAYNLAYLEFHSPTGSIRLKLQQPTVGGCDPEANSCADNFPATNQLTYCCQDNCTRVPGDSGACRCSYRPGFKHYDCQFLDGDSAGIPQRGSIFIATKNKVETQSINQNCTKPGVQDCPKLWHIDSISSSFVAGIETFTLLADHSAQVPSLKFFEQARDLQGYLQVPKGGRAQERLCSTREAYAAPVAGQLTTTSPCYLKPLSPNDNSSLDIFTVQELLVAAGLGSDGLDQESFEGSGHSVRYEGMTMTMDIHYFNTLPWRGPLYTPGYYYQMTAMTKNAYGQHAVQKQAGSTGRVVNAFHGILLQATVTGRIGVFSFNNLLIQIAASSALLGMAVLVVDISALYCCKYRKYYRHALVERSPDFSDVERLEGTTDEDLRDMCRRRSLPVGGSHVALVIRLSSDENAPTPDGSSFHSSSGGREALAASGEQSVADLARPIAGR
mmetsp:Transcript_13054/g.46430  ORF Transcript_13054/g.46430 Transcript_13054/m.46430 type:complete len:503 (+) Transcript_13054:81-1589(+)